MYYPGLNENYKTGIWTWLYLFYGFIITLVAFIWALPIFHYHLCPQNVCLSECMITNVAIESKSDYKIRQCCDYDFLILISQNNFILVRKLWCDRSSNGLTAIEGPGRRLYRCLPPGRETSVWFFGSSPLVIYFR